MQWTKRGQLALVPEILSANCHGLVTSCNQNTFSVVLIASAVDQLSRVVRKPGFCICENKDADQLRGNREADQRLCFRYTDSTIPLLSKSEISSL